MASNLNDIILNKNYDLQIDSVTGDFIVGNSDEQSANLIIQLFPGNMKQFPTSGVGILNYLASNTSQDRISQVIKQQLTIDGFTVQSLSVDANGKINLSATR